jgi:hypothetical protein
MPNQETSLISIHETTVLVSGISVKIARLNNSLGIQFTMMNTVRSSALKRRTIRKAP